jgi:hypothetical protein
MVTSVPSGAVAELQPSVSLRDLPGAGAVRRLPEEHPVPCVMELVQVPPPAVPVTTPGGRRPGPQEHSFGADTARERGREPRR